MALVNPAKVTATGAVSGKRLCYGWNFRETASSTARVRLLDGAYAAPGIITAALADPAVAGNVDNGAHTYKATFVNALGETTAGTVSATVTVVDKTVNGQVSLTAIPTGPTGTTARKIYRTEAGGSTYKLLTTLSNNTTTTYTDNTADGSLGATAPTTNTTGIEFEDIALISGQSVGENYPHPLRCSGGDLFVEIVSGTVTGSVKVE